jgi:uncharacterized protein (AIM24 family)
LEFYNANRNDCIIQGGEVQLVEVELDPNETVIAEAMGCMEEGIEFEAYNGGFSQARLQVARCILMCSQ